MKYLPHTTLKKEWNVTWSGSEPHSTSEDGIECRFSSGGHGSRSGTYFRASPTKIFPTKECTLTYKVYVPPDFDFVRGGKLPGLFINEGAGGGSWNPRGASARVMWRANGHITAYLYPAAPNAEAAARKQGEGFRDICRLTNNTGIDCFESSGMKLKKGGWNQISIGVRVNDPNKNNGSITIACNEKDARFNKMRWSDHPFNIDGIAFSTWFGGSDKSWAPKTQQKLIFKDFCVS
jgi:hypothetical protein